MKKIKKLTRDERKKKSDNKRKVTNDNWFIKWEKTRKLGLAKYTFFYGFLMWGSLTSLFFQVINRFSKEFVYTSFYAQVLIPTLVFMIGGIFVGIALWLISENKYKKQINEIELARKLKKEKKINRKNNKKNKNKQA